MASNLDKLLKYLLQEHVQDTNNQDIVSEEIEEIAQYPKGFSIDTLKGLKSFAAKVRYLQQFNLEKLGVGSSRAVFVADSNTVIKIAKNKKGIAQNKAEIGISTEHLNIGAGTEGKNIGDILSQKLAKSTVPLALIKDADPDGIWVEAERARRAQAEDFKKIIGVSMAFFMQALKIKRGQIKGSRQWSYFFDFETPANKKLYNQIFSSEFFSDLLEIIMTHDLAIGVVERISSWGVVRRGANSSGGGEGGRPQLVLIDYGLTSDVLNTHYMG
jgi:hypothetical protein